MVCGIEPRPAAITIQIGSILVETPDIIRCAVSRGRGEVAKANFSFFYRGQDQLGNNNIDGYVFIWFGPERQSSFLVFSRGTVKQSNINPSGRCAGEMSVSITAEDLMYRVTNKRLTRRQRQSGLSPMAIISSVFKRTYLAYDDPASIHDIATGSSPIDFITHTPNMSEWTQFVKGGEQNTIAKLHPVTKVTDEFTFSRGGTGEGTPIGFHDHASMDPVTGLGPAVATFGQK